MPSVVFSHERIGALFAVPLGWVAPTRHIADAWNRQLAAQSDTVVCPTADPAGEFVRIDARRSAPTC